MDSRYQLILQPMTRAEVLRYWLQHNGFAVEAERLAADGGEIYAVFAARFGAEMSLSDAELYTGSFSLVEKEDLWPAFLELQLARVEKLLDGLRRSGREAGRLALMENIYRELKERKEYGNCLGDLS